VPSLEGRGVSREGPKPTCYWNAGRGITPLMPNLLTKIVTPAFITFNAHCWFAYATVFTFFHWWIVPGALIAAGVKEFYIDKHFEVDQTFGDNAADFSGYLAGILLAICAHYFL
jgi:hypothetical protein